MSKKANRRSSRSSKAKKEGASGIEYPVSQHTLGESVRHALSSGWVQNLGCACVVFFIALVVAIMTRTQVKTAAFSFASACTLFVWFLAIVAIHCASEPKEPELVFTFLTEMSDLSHRSDSGVFWFRYSSGYEDTLSPVSAAFYVSVKNPRSSPAFIEELQVSVQKRGAKWLTLKSIPAESGRIYWIYGDLTKAQPLSMSSLDGRLRSSIPAGETILGWMFWALPEECASEGDQVRWKVRAKDSAGGISEYESAFETVTSRSPEPSPSLSQSGSFVISGNKEDLSKLCIRNYAPLPRK